MKKLLLILVLLVPLCTLAQSKEPVIQLHKKSSSGKAALAVKPNRKIIIKTLNNVKFTFHYYKLVGDSLIVSGRDTIPLNYIKSVKVNVEGDVLRKAGGVVVAAAGVYFGAVGSLFGFLVFLTGGGPLYLLLPAPAVAVGIYGYEMAGARRFNTSKWEMSLIEQP